jgi:hypothetical protein
MSACSFLNATSRRIRIGAGLHHDGANLGTWLSRSDGGMRFLLDRAKGGDIRRRCPS